MHQTRILRALGLIAALVLVVLSLSSSGRNRARELRLLELVEQPTPPIDVVLGFPTVEVDNPQSNFTVLSILRFAPWVRRIHLHLPPSSPSSSDAVADHWQDWKEHRHSRLIYVREKELSGYYRHSPYLSERFIFWPGGRLLVNYVFPWEFFVDEHPVRRNDLIPMTRALWGELQSVPPVLPERRPVREVPRSSSGFDRDELEGWFRHSRPHRLGHEMVLVLLAGVEDDLQIHLEERHDACWQVWCLFHGRAQKPRPLLSWIHRMTAAQRSTIRVIGDEHGWELERLGAATMKALKERFGRYRIAEIVCTGSTRELGEKLATAFDRVPVSMARPLTDSDRQQPEFRRLLEL